MPRDSEQLPGRDIKEDRTRPRQLLDGIYPLADNDIPVQRQQVGGVRAVVTPGAISGTALIQGEPGIQIQGVRAVRVHVLPD
jgi:hypothetical protein